MSGLGNIGGSEQTPFNPLRGAEGPQGQPATPFKLGDQRAIDAWNEFKKLWDKPTPPPLSNEERLKMDRDLALLQQLALSSSSDPKEQAAITKLQNALKYLFKDPYNPQHPMPTTVDQTITSALEDLKNFKP